MDEKIISLSIKNDKKHRRPLAQSSPLKDLKRSLNQKLDKEIANKHAAKVLRHKRSMRDKHIFITLTVSLLATALLSGVASTGWAYVSQDKQRILRENHRLNIEYSQIKSRNLALENKIMALLERHEISDLHNHELHELSTELTQAITQLKNHRKEILLKHTLTNDTLNERIATLKDTFDQGKLLLSQFNHVMLSLDHCPNP